MGGLTPGERRLLRLVRNSQCGGCERGIAFAVSCGATPFSSSLSPYCSGNDWSWSFFVRPCFGCRCACGRRRVDCTSWSGAWVVGNRSRGTGGSHRAPGGAGLGPGLQYQTYRRSVGTVCGGCHGDPFQRSADTKSAGDSGVSYFTAGGRVGRCRDGVSAVRNTGRDCARSWPLQDAGADCDGKASRRAGKISGCAGATADGNMEDSCRLLVFGFGGECGGAGGRFAKGSGPGSGFAETAVIELLKPSLSAGF